MEDKYPIKEIKIMEGVYIQKPQSKTENNSQKNKNNESSDSNNTNLNSKKELIGENKYICHGVNELVKIYEIEFEEIGNKILSLFQSNEEMLEFDPYDYDLIQAREENLQLIDKKIEEMTKIQKKMKEICSYHPLVDVNIFEYFGIGKKQKDEKGYKKDNNKNEENLNIINDLSGCNLSNLNELEQNKDNNSSTEQSHKHNNVENDNEIITEIDL